VAEFAGPSTEACAADAPRGCGCVPSPAGNFDLSQQGLTVDFARAGRVGDWAETAADIQYRSRGTFCQLLCHHQRTSDRQGERPIDLHLSEKSGPKAKVRVVAGVQP
jgi:hypothetical protein